MTLPLTAWTAVWVASWRYGKDFPIFLFIFWGSPTLIVALYFYYWFGPLHHAIHIGETAASIVQSLVTSLSDFPVLTLLHNLATFYGLALFALSLISGAVIGLTGAAWFSSLR